MRTGIARSLIVGLSALALTAAVPTVAHAQSPITPSDYGKWETVRTGRLSPHGDWLAVPIARVNEENELRVHSTKRDSVVVIPFATRAAFSADGSWLAYSIEKSPDELKALEKKEEPVRNDLGLLNLRTGELSTVEQIASSLFSGTGRYLLMRRYAAENAPKGSAAIIVRDLTTGGDINFGSVSEYAWQDEGDLLAFAVRAEDDLGNAVQLYDPASRVLRSLDAIAARYSRLTWRDESDDLAALRAFTDEMHPDTSHVLMVWKGLTDRRTRTFVLDPVAAKDLNEHTRIVSYRRLTWSDEGDAVFFGVKEWPIDEEAGDSSATTEDSVAAESEEEEEEEEEKPEVEVWNWKDRRVIPEQKRDSTRDAQRSDLAVWHLETSKIITLTDESLERVRIAAGGRVVTAIATEPYAFDRMFGRNHEDVYTIDVKSGERTLVAERVPFSFGASPDGRYVLFFDDDQYHAYDLRSSMLHEISASAATEFANVDYDHPVDQKPPYGVAGWTEDDRSVLVYDKYDVWELRPGDEPRRLTAGAESQIQYRYVDVDPDEAAIDRSDDVYLRMEGEWTLHHGYSRLRGNRVERLVYQDDYVSALTKADSTDIFTYLVQDFDDSPDHWVADTDFDTPRQVTASNPFHGDFAWGHSELVPYENANGRRLHGALFYPANYDPSERYPMITYIYEIRSWSAKRYSVPSERSAYNPAVWTAQGYFVFQPDIVFEVRDPGISSARTLELAVAAVSERGLIDPDRVGLVGHSWGGYQTAFVVTETDVFAAAVAGAPLTNLVSMYGSIFWTVNVPESGHFEVGQERMDVPPWEDIDAYIRNSAVFNVNNLNTPLMVEVGDNDRNVDWSQGIEYYNAARRAQKELVMIVYHAEGHGLRKKPNQIDYHNRILEWFGHFLKGQDAPTWILEGVPFSQQ